MTRLLIFLFLACLLPATASAGLSETLVKVKPSVVAIASYTKLRSPARIMFGTGFVVGDGQTVITNAHVVSRVLDENETLIVLVPGAEPRQIEARVVGRKPEYDLAVLRIKSDPLPALKLANQESIREGQEIAFTGFPLGEVLGLTPVTHRGIISAITPIAMPGGNAKQINEAAIMRLRRGSFTVYQLDATAYPSNSGSPMYDAETGEVVGIINMVFVKGSKEAAISQPSGISFAIPVKYLAELLATVR